MKKVFSFKALALVLMLVLSIAMFTACKKDEIDIPEFSISIIDGDQTITLTNNDVKELDLVSMEKTKKDVTTYYKCFKLNDVLTAKNISITGITSVEFSEKTDDPENDYTKEISTDNLSTGILAVFFSETKDGEFQPIGTEKGPIRGFGDPDADVKNLNTITIKR